MWNIYFVFLCFNIFNTDINRLQQFRWAFLYLCSYLYSSPSSDSESSSESEKQLRPYLSLSLSIFSSHSLQSFNWFEYLSGTSNVCQLGALEVLGLLIILGLGALKALHLGLLWLCTWNILLKLLLMVTVPVFFHVFTDGAVWSPSTLLCFWCCCCTGGYLFLGSVALFYRGFWCSNSSRSRRDQPVLPQLKEIPWHLSCFGPWGASAWVGMFLSGWGLLSEVPSCEGFWLSEFVGALGVVTGGCAVALLVLDLGLATTFTLYFFVGISFFLFSVALVSFLIWGLVSKSCRSRLIWLGLEFWTQLPF